MDDVERYFHFGSLVHHCGSFFLVCFVDTHHASPSTATGNFVRRPRKVRVQIQKCDPYFCNGTLLPYHTILCWWTLQQTMVPRLETAKNFQHQKLNVCKRIH